MLITRPEPGAGETARRVAALGFVPVVAPVLAVGTRPARLPAPASVQAVLATSGNAVGAIPAMFHGRVLLAVGDATAARARDAGFLEVHSAGGDATALADLAARRCLPSGGALLLAAGEGQGSRLAAALRLRRFRVIRRAVYAARPVPSLPPTARAALEQGRLGAALFFSSASAHAFVRLLTLAMRAEAVTGLVALAISGPTAAALAPLPWRHIRVASRPNQDELLALLQ